MLDTVNEHGGWQGSIGADQLAWLIGELVAATDRIVVLFSHHPLESLVNARCAPGAPRRVLGPELRTLLLAHRCVVLWVNGHSHRHRISPITAGDGAGGFWQVTTASHIDWPQQSRIVELLDDGAGRLSVCTTVLDSAAPAGHDGGEGVLSLAALSREIAANHWQARGPAARTIVGSGGPLDRNTTLLVPFPPSPASYEPTIPYARPAAWRPRRETASTVAASSRTAPVTTNLVDDSTPSRSMPLEMEKITSPPRRAE